MCLLRYATVRVVPPNVSVVTLFSVQVPEQGTEYLTDTDNSPFGVVVMDRSISYGGTPGWSTVPCQLPKNSAGSAAVPDGGGADGGVVVVGGCDECDHGTTTARGTSGLRGIDVSRRWSGPNHSSPPSPRSPRM